MTRILVTGSREWDDTQTIHAALQKQLDDNGEITVVHGGAKGADQIAGAWARQAIDNDLPVRLEVFPADWDAHGRKAGIVRNMAMLATKPDLVLAFPKGDSRGTRHCVLAAERASIPVIRFEAGQ